MVKIALRPQGVDKLTLRDIPAMTEYVTISQAAEMLGMTRNGIFYKVYEQRAFNTVVKVAEEDDEDDGARNERGFKKRPVLLIKRWEVEAIASGELPKKVKNPALLLRDWNRRVKAWGESSGKSEFRIAATGAPRRQLVEAYLEANPDDPRPE